MKKLFFTTLALSFISSSLMAKYTKQDAIEYANDMCGFSTTMNTLRRCADAIAATKYELEQLNEENNKVNKSKQTKSNKTNKKRQEDYCAPNNPYC